MKAIITTVIVLLIFSSCGTNKLTIREDSYKKETQAVLEQSFFNIKHAKEARIKVEKFLLQDSSSLPVMYLTVNTKGGYLLDKDLFFDVDGQVFSLQFDLLGAKSEMYYDETTTGDYPNQVTDTDEIQLTVNKGISSLSKSLIEAIKKSKAVAIRIYLDREPVMLRLSQSKLNKWKEFLAIEQLDR